MKYCSWIDIKADCTVRNLISRLYMHERRFVYAFHILELDTLSVSGCFLPLIATNGTFSIRSNSLLVVHSVSTTNIITKSRHPKQFKADILYNMDSLNHKKTRNEQPILA